MKTHAFLALAAASCIVGAGVLTAGGDDDAIKKDRKQIAGTWRVISFEKDGKKTPAEQLEKTRTIYSADGKFMVQREGKTVIAGNTKIDPTKKPKQSEGTYTDGELKGMTVLGIYEIDGDNMRGCFALPGKDRPTEFSSKPDSGHVLIVYKRDVPAKQKDPPKEFTNSIGMKFVWIPPGTFQMGKPGGQRGDIPDVVQHKVTLTKGFYLGVYTVTQEQWQAVMGNNPSYHKGQKNLPVEVVSWEECQEFLKKLSKKDGHAYRMPTEAEWEYACRAGSTGAYHYGDDPKLLGQYAWFINNSANKTHPVGQKKPNGWGLFDMNGNVDQWCADWYGNYPQEAVVDPTGPEIGKKRVYRGGAYIRDASSLASSHRDSLAPGPTSRIRGIGLRVATTISP